jgi:hypothetical protein
MQAKGNMDGIVLGFVGKLCDLFKRYYHFCIFCDELWGEGKIQLWRTEVAD